MRQCLFILIAALGIGCSTQRQATVGHRQVANVEEDGASTRSFDLPLATDLGEYKVPGEDAAIEDLQKLLIGHMVKYYSSPESHAYRAIHAKGHGCVNAKFEVLRDFDSELKVGVFAHPRTFDALIRFSNGDGPPEDDSKLESRGMAVKLLGVKGEKILTGDVERNTQDFLMADQPAFFLKDVADYRKSIKAREGDLLDKAEFGVKFHKELAFRNSATPILNPLNAQYWSKTPYQLGSHVIKFSARPCIFPPMESPPRHTKNFMKEEMKNQLALDNVCFEFLVQKRITEGDQDREMPIEDASKIWSDTLSPFVRVARIHIPKQDFDTDEKNASCENLSFSPWHALKEQRPLGSLNRIRKIIYDELSDWRRQHNHVPPIQDYI